jgi:hypothetical protein
MYLGRIVEIAPTAELFRAPNLAAAMARDVKLGSRAQRGMPLDGYIGPVTEVTVANNGIWLPNHRGAATARGEGLRTRWHPRKSYLRSHQDGSRTAATTVLLSARVRFLQQSGLF